MLKSVIVFFLAFLIGLFVQATLVHSFESAWVAPDFILILVVYLGLHHKSPAGAVGAFVLGLGADFAEARFVGPNAAGAVLAFCLTVEISNRIYAEKGPATVLVTVVASATKLVAYALMLMLYTKTNVFSGPFAWTVVKEIVLTALFAPLVMKLLGWGRGRSISRVSDAYRR